jgi:hypothetical protein
VLAQEKDRAAEIKKLLAQRAELLDEAGSVIVEQFFMGLATPVDVRLILQDSLQAKLDIQTSGEGRVAVLRSFRKLAEKFYESVDARHKVGVAKQLDADLARGAFLTAWIELLREEVKLKADPEKTAQIDKLRKQRIEAFDAVIENMTAIFAAGFLDVHEVLYAHRDALDARLALCSKDDERFVVLDKYRNVVAGLVLKVPEVQKKRDDPARSDLDRAKASLLEVRIELLRVGQKLRPDPAAAGEIKKLLQERLERLEAVDDWHWSTILSSADVLQVKRDVRRAKLELQDNAEKRSAVLRGCLKKAEELVETAKLRNNYNQVCHTRAEVLAIRVELLREEAKLTPAQKK